MEPEITVKSTKNEILEAYNALLKRIKEQKPVDRQAEKEKVEKKEIVETAAQNSVEKIVKGLADIKLAITKSLDEMEQQLIGEFKKLNGIRQAIDIEKKNLEEVHEIRLNADSLAALLLAQKEKKQAFETEIEQRKSDFDAEMTQKKLLWKKEQEDYERLKKEREEEVKKARQREEEEYTYNLKLQRKKDQDAYAASKATLEKELEEKRLTLEKTWSEREAALAAREKELADLKARVDLFPKELEKTVKDTEKSVTEKLQFIYKHQAEMLATETEGEKKLYQQLIASLETKIKEQEEQIRQLTQKTNEAGLQVQSIAIKAIEGASTWRVPSVSHERSSEPGVR
jgi:hypothetical protein